MLPRGRESKKAARDARRNLPPHKNRSVVPSRKFRHSGRKPAPGSPGTREGDSSAPPSDWCVLGMRAEVERRRARLWARGPLGSADLSSSPDRDIRVLSPGSLALPHPHGRHL